MQKVAAFFLAFLAVALAAATMGTLGTTESFSHTLTLDPHGDFVLYWNYNSSHVTFEVHVKTRGYVGFGLSPNGKMYPSDVVVGWVKDGKSYFKDYHTSGHYAPMADASQDWHLLHASDGDLGTILKFVRKINTCDPDDIAINNGTQRLIYSYHTDDPRDENSLMYHSATRRGTKSVSLLNQQQPSLIYDTDTTMKVIEIRPNNYVMPDKDTTYLCVGFQMPDLGGKHHMIEFEPVYTPGNERFLHHFVVERCPGVAKSMHGHTTECYYQWPKEWSHCTEVVLGWATGGGPYYFPDDAGYSIGGPDDPSFYVMQIHYDNPDHLSGIVDNSGVRLRLTSSLRKHEVGSLIITQSVSPFHVIPPRQQSFITRGFCDGNILAKAMVDAGVTEITAISTLQHAHLLSYGIKTRHFRNGTELEPIMDDPNYDFYFQEFRNFPERIIKAGDDLRVECNYSTLARSEVAFGGLSTREEMCESIMYVYPKLDIFVCGSFTDWHAIYPEVDYRNNTEAENIVRKHVQHDYDWTDPDVRNNFTAIIDSSPFIHYTFGYKMVNQTELQPNRQSSIFTEPDDDYVPYVYPDACKKA